LSQMMAAWKAAADTMADAAEEPRVSEEEEEEVEAGKDDQGGGGAAGAAKKKKKKAKKKGVAGGEDEAPTGISGTKALQEAISSLQLSGQGGRPSSAGQQDIEQHAFWDTQPMRRPDEQPETGGPIEPADKHIPQEPYNLPAGFVWCTCDVKNDEDMEDLYKLLNVNYVEDDDNMFRFDYSRDFLRWALTPPNYFPEWHIGVRTEKTGRLVGCITAIPATIKAWGQSFSSVEINFLCVHKKLRSKRLAPVLIKEVTRRVNVKGRFQAVYTAGAVLPTPVASCRYYHRSLSPKKLIEVGFSRLGPRMTMARTIKLYALPPTPQLPGLRPIELRDVPSATRLLAGYLRQFQLAPVLDTADFEYFFMGREGVIYTYVLEDPNTKEVTDMLSFYALPSTIIGNKQYPTLRAAYSFYNVPGTVSLKALLEDALIVAKSLDFDVFNALNLFGNQQVLEELKFGIGDGNLQYYLYNWRCRDMTPSDVGLVLL